MWEQQQKLLASDGEAGDSFGCSVSISGDTVVVGAYEDKDLGTFSGSAYIFVRNESNMWNQQQKLLASDGEGFDYFGHSVSISGDTVVVGATRADDSGAVYIFVRNEANMWEQQQKLLASDGQINDYFGYSVSISGESVVVGATDDDDLGMNSGAAYIFVRNESSIWEQQQKLLASDGQINDYFGDSVSISGDTVVVGVYYDGSAFIFTNMSCESGCVNQQMKWIEEDKCCSKSNDERICYQVCGGHYCEIKYECDFIPMYEISVCDNHGDCIRPNECKCNIGYKEKYCDEWTCGSIPNLNESQVCSGHGKCSSYDTCECEYGYFGKFCEKWTCNSILNNETNSVCSGQGNCTAFETCKCDEDGDYFGRFCNLWKCFDISKDESNVCSGNGFCGEIGKCFCNNGYSGEKCEKRTSDDILQAITTALSITGSVIGVLVVFILLLIGLLIVIIISITWKKKLKRFEAVEDIELIVAESEAEKGSGLNKVKISKSMLSVDPSKLKKIKRLGAGGSSGSVFLCEYQNQQVVSKEWKVEMNDDETFDEFEREVQLMTSLNHPNIINFLGFIHSPPRVALIMEFGSLGDLKHYFVENKNLSLDERMEFVIQICSAVSFLHSKEIIRKLYSKIKPLDRDLKPQNVVVCENRIAKLLDFGLSKVVEKMDKTKTYQVGTSHYMAPEMVLGDDYNFKIDVFSLSIMVYEMIVMDWNPFKDNQGSGSIEMKMANNPNLRPDLEKIEQKWMKELLERGWVHEQNYEEKQKWVIKDCLFKTSFSK